MPSNCPSFGRKIMELGRKTLGFVLVFAACAGAAFARQHVPEIDPGSSASAIAFFVGGMLLLMPRRQPLQK
jgi:hypothetical protein